ncbi:glycerophosphoryl diester phosphodiesterase, partial [Bacteroides ovatus]
ISFPRGFMTPKVGTHRTAGFASGIVDGKKASLILRKDLVSVDNPNVDYITAESEDGSVLFVVLLNNQAKENNLNMIVRSSQLASDKEMKDYTKQVKLNAFGYKIIKIKL